MTIFTKMSRHRYTDEKGKPVTMLRDQSKQAKASGIDRVFLIKHPGYPEHKCIDDWPIMEVKPLVDCNGFCGTNDLVSTAEVKSQLIAVG